MVANFPDKKGKKGGRGAEGGNKTNKPPRTLPKGPERNHLLATATAAAAANTTTTAAGAAAASDASRPPNRTASPTVAAGSVATSLDPGAAWMWAAGARDMPRMIFYNDV